MYSYSCIMIVSIIVVSLNYKNNNIECKAGHLDISVLCNMLNHVI